MTLSEPPLLPAQRRERLLADLRARGTLRVSEIARALGVTPVTVRRDIAQLADEGAIVRVHGGIRLPQGHHTVASDEPASDENAYPAVGMVVPSLDYYWPEIIRGARHAASGNGLRIVLRGSSYDDVADVRRQVAWLLETVGVQGLMIAPPTLGEEAGRLVTWLSALGIPVTFVERTATVGPYREHVESVSTDHVFGASLAVRHLAAQGHSKLGFLASATSPTTPAVRRGWRETVAEPGLAVAATVDVTTPDYRDSHWLHELDAALDACIATGTTALVVHSDREAISLVARCEERGINVPGQLAVVAYDDEVAGLANPALSAIRPAKFAIGEAAVQLLAQRVHSGQDRPVHRIRISPQLVIRDSSIPAYRTR